MLYKFGFAERGRVYVPILIKPRHDNIMLPLDFKVDTGADYSTISKVNLSGLGFDMDWITENVVPFGETEKPTTAAGVSVDAGYVQLPLLNLLGYECINWAFQIVLDEKYDFRNLLGRDLLSNFNFTFNHDEDYFTISRTKSLKSRFRFLSGQEIHEAVSTF